jgi:hypothetical protein
MTWPPALRAIVGEIAGNEEADVSDNESSARPRQRSTAFVAGAALLGGAGVLGLAGLGLTTAALVAAVRVRMNRMPVPPRDLARHTLRQTRAATTAGRNAWREVKVPPTARAGDDSKITSGR